jgi:hypothetical protein
MTRGSLNRRAGVLRDQGLEETAELTRGANTMAPEPST